MHFPDYLFEDSVAPNVFCRVLRIIIKHYVNVNTKFPFINNNRMKRFKSCKLIFLKYWDFFTKTFLVSLDSVSEKHMNCYFPKHLKLFTSILGLIWATFMNTNVKSTVHIFKLYLLSIDFYIYFHVYLRIFLNITHVSFILYIMKSKKLWPKERLLWNTAKCFYSVAMTMFYR